MHRVPSGFILIYLSDNLGLLKSNGSDHLNTLPCFVLCIQSQCQGQFGKLSATDNMTEKPDMSAIVLLY